MMNRKKRIFAIPAKEAAIPPKPKSAATRAIILGVDNALLKKSSMLLRR